MYSGKVVHVLLIHIKTYFSLYNILTLILTVMPMVSSLLRKLDDHMHELATLSCTGSMTCAVPLCIMCVICL